MQSLDPRSARASVNEANVSHCDEATTADAIASWPELSPPAAAREQFPLMPLTVIQNAVVSVLSAPDCCGDAELMHG